ncbi:hypothetical protein LXL04_021301 [Taraxacum kok-saghyz]
MASKASGTQSMESTATGAKRKSNDVGWEYCFFPDPTNLDKVQCILCAKSCSGGVYRIKQHIAHVTGNVSPCPKSTKTDQFFLEPPNFIEPLPIENQDRAKETENYRILNGVQHQAAKLQFLKFPLFFIQSNTNETMLSFKFPTEIGILLKILSFRVFQIHQIKP